MMYVLREAEILQCLCPYLAFSRIINILETIQLVSFFTRCEEETFIKAKLYGVQGVDVSNTGTCWWSHFLALSFCDNLLMWVYLGHVLGKKLQKYHMFCWCRHQGCILISAIDWISGACVNISLIICFWVSVVKIKITVGIFWFFYSLHFLEQPWSSPTLLDCAYWGHSLH
jgi:hypothetical protein